MKPDDAYRLLFVPLMVVFGLTLWPMRGSAECTQSLNQLMWAGLLSLITPLSLLMVHWLGLLFIFFVGGSFLWLIPAALCLCRAVWAGRRSLLVWAAGLLVLLANLSFFYSLI